jgi:hypothetical protein
MVSFGKLVRRAEGHGDRAPLGYDLVLIQGIFSGIFAGGATLLQVRLQLLSGVVPHEVDSATAAVFEPRLVGSSFVASTGLASARTVVPHLHDIGLVLG